MDFSHDKFWKSLIEDFTEPLIWYLNPELAAQIDFARGVVFLDKELDGAFANIPETTRIYVDSLIKVFNNNGSEEYLLIHIEVQDSSDADFGHRMFRYFVRVYERHDRPMTAMAIFTDDSPSFRPKSFEINSFGTTNLYCFNTFKLLDQSYHALVRHNPDGSVNIFSYVFQVAWMDLKKNQPKTEADWLNFKLEIARRLSQEGYSDAYIHRFLVFLYKYVPFQKSENRTTFADQIFSLYSTPQTMGILEMVKQEQSKIDERERRLQEKYRLEILNEGIEKGIEKLLRANFATPEQIASVFEVSLETVLKIQARLEQ